MVAYGLGSANGINALAGLRTLAFASARCGAAQRVESAAAASAGGGALSRIIVMRNNKRINIGMANEEQK